jgi:hypothetical protein
MRREATKQWGKVAGISVSRLLPLLLLLFFLSVSPLMMQAQARTLPVRAAGEATGDRATHPDRVIVRLESGLTSEILRDLASLGMEPLGEPSYGLLLCTAPSGFIAASTATPPGIRWMEPDITFRATASPPNDPDYPKQWNLPDIKAVQAWGQAGGGSDSVVVAVVDSGVAYRDSDVGPIAPDLRNTRFVDGYDAIANDSYPDDENGHGTLVAEVLASNFNNGLRAAGIAYGCSVMPVRVLGGDAAGDASTVAKGIYWAADSGARIICLALSSTQHSEAVGEAVKYAYARGALCIAASGNEGSNPGYPGGMDCPADEGPYVLAVGATDAREERANYSNYGEDLDLVAPGGDLTRDDNADGYPDGIPQESFREVGLPQAGFALTWNEGTSLAVPQVAAAAVMLLSSRGDLNPGQLSTIITSSCRDLGAAGKDIYYGYGMLDIPAALNSVVSSGWYFAEGTTQAGFDQWFCVANPNTTTAHVEFTFYQEDGTTSIQDYDIAATSRFTLSANSAVGEGLYFATRIDSDISIVAERPMYFDYKNGWTGGTAVLGARELSQTWYFAEGYTARDQFDTYLCMLNPWPDAASVTVGFIFNNNPTGVKYIEKQYSIPKNSRFTISENVEAGYDSEISTIIVSGLPIVAERPMYFNYKDKWNGGHDVVGATIPSISWQFAEGTTREGFDTWLCLANPDSGEAKVTVDYLSGPGQGPTITREYTVPTRSRYTINVNDEVGKDKDVSMQVRSTLPIVAERPMYFNYGGNVNDGHDVVGAIATSNRWRFAEGTTREGFDTWLCLANPGDTDAAVTVTYLLGPGQGPNVTRTYTVPADTRYTIKVNDEVGPDKDVSMEIESSLPVVAERPMYFIYQGVWDGGHDVVGSPGG